MSVIAGQNCSGVMAIVRVVDVKTVAGVVESHHGKSGQTKVLINSLLPDSRVIENARRAGHGSSPARHISGKVSAKPRVSEELSPLELLRQENELLRETINSADKDIEEIEAQLKVTESCDSC